MQNFKARARSPGAEAPKGIGARTAYGPRAPSLHRAVDSRAPAGGAIGHSTPQSPRTAPSSAAPSVVVVVAAAASDTGVAIPFDLIRPRVGTSRAHAPTAEVRRVFRLVVGRHVPGLEAQRDDLPQRRPRHDLAGVQRQAFCLVRSAAEHRAPRRPRGAGALSLRAIRAVSPMPISPMPRNFSKPNTVTDLASAALAAGALGRRRPPRALTRERQAVGWA